MRCGELPPAEWAALEGTELGPMLSTLDPSVVRVAAVWDDDDQLVACWGTLLVFHCDGLWIRREFRGDRRLVRQMLWKVMAKFARAVGASGFVTFAVRRGIGRMCERWGGSALPGRAYRVPLER